MGNTRSTEPEVEDILRLIKSKRLPLGTAAAAGMLMFLSPALANTLSGPTMPRKLVVGYLASWKLCSGERVSSLPVNRLTDMLYAFGNLSSEGLAELGDPCLDVGDCRSRPSPCGPGGAFASLAVLKRQHPTLKLLISFGGWNGSKYFSLAAANDEVRRRFARSVIRVFFLPHPGLFDGVNIDWEYPGEKGAPDNLVNPLDGEHLISLLKTMRRSLDRLSASTGHPYELSLAIPADRDKAARFHFGTLSRTVDWFDMMSYDYYNGATIAGFNAPLYASAKTPTPQMNVDSSVRMVLAAGVPRRKLVLGLPFYGHAYSNVPPKNDGLFQPADPNAPAFWGGRDGIDYRDIVARQPTKNGFVRHWDADARVPWLYNPRTRIWISYDDAESIQAKSAYVRSRRLAGVMIWQLSGDDGSLLRAALKGLNREKSTLHNN